MPDLPKETTLSSLVHQGVDGLPSRQYGSSDRPVKKSLSINGRELFYVEQGQGQPIVFLHGNWCSSYVWRNVMPLLADHWRCIALDFPGFGDSEYPNCGESNTDFLDCLSHTIGELLSAIGAVENVTLVMYGMSTMIGCDWAMRNQEKVRALVYSSGCFVDASGLAKGDAAIGTIDEYRTARMQSFWLESDSMVDMALSVLVDTPLDERVLAEYRRPFLGSLSSRIAMVRWLNCVPSGGEPQDAFEHVLRHSSWLRYAKIPKLMLSHTKDEYQHFKSFKLVANAFAHYTERQVEGCSLLAEDNPVEYAAAIANWLSTLPEDSWYRRPDGVDKTSPQLNAEA